MPAAGDYFFYHHTEGDTMTVLDREQMDIAAATVAVHAYGTAPIIMPCLMSVAATSCGDGSSSRLIDWLVD